MIGASSLQSQYWVSTKLVPNIDFIVWTLVWALHWVSSVRLSLHVPVSGWNLDMCIHRQRASTISASLSPHSTFPVLEVRNWIYRTTLLIAIVRPTCILGLLKAWAEQQRTTPSSTCKFVRMQNVP